MVGIECIGSLTTRFSDHLLEKINAVSTVASTQSSDGSLISATELDSHADSPVVGKNAVILESLNKLVQVSGFSSEIGRPIRVKVVHAAVIYDCDITGESHILVLYNALHIPSMVNNLVPPFAMRLAGLEVNECPKFLAKRPTIAHHSAYFPDAGVRIPFKIEGIVSYFPTRIPSREELTRYSGEYLMLTPNGSEWDPHTDVYKEQTVW